MRSKTSEYKNRLFGYNFANKTGLFGSLAQLISYYEQESAAALFYTNKEDFICLDSLPTQQIFDNSDEHSNYS